MRKIFILFIFLAFESYGHDRLKLSGTVIDEGGLPLPGAHVFLDEKAAVSGVDGGFEFSNLEPKSYIVKCNYVGYHPYQSEIWIKNDTSVSIILAAASIRLDEVVVTGAAEAGAPARSVENIGSAQILERYSGSFIKSVETLPGVNSMDIGAAMSKPVVRGMGFNRVAVAENGVKQEGQQWGADHGLEIDPFNVEKASIVRGASSIEYGSDAIGGVIEIDNSGVPEKNSFSGNAAFLAKSVNHTVGGSLFAQYRGDRYYFKLRSTILDYGDYATPTDEIRYLNYNIPVYNNRLKNTAGAEKDIHVAGGYLSDRFRTSMSVSRVNQLNGFFPGSHGIPSLKRVEDDGDRRNVEYPYQHTIHFKAISNSVWIAGAGDLHLDLGYQSNRRREWSQFHTHFTGQAPPEINPCLELDFHLRTYSANVKYHFHAAQHHFTLGAQNQFQDNDIEGYNFFLPVFQTASAGVYAKDDWNVGKKVMMSMGLRLDWGKSAVEAHFDSLLYRDLIGRGYEQNQAAQYAHRSVALKKPDMNLSWMIGLDYEISGKWTSRFNLGKSFRMPLAIELGANGVHHGSFRHETGDPGLNSETGHYIDAGLEYHAPDVSLSFNPYLYYFSNYIYLNPTGTWSFLAHAGQIYEYTQSKAMLSGMELSITNRIGGHLKFSGNMEYIYNRQLSGRYKNYPLPYTPPLNGFAELEYGFGSFDKNEWKYSLRLNGRFAARQNHLAINEESTPGYDIYGLALTGALTFGKQSVHVSLQGHNLFNARYFNHISFYRKLEIPEPGRNIQLLVRIPINVRL